MISVIVPVYNVEKYLDTCVRTILGQTFAEFELILVDDGSTDNSGKMCDEYAKKDSRIKVIHKKNGGPSEARNVAAQVANGEMITFIDSDDFVIKDYLELLRESLEQFDADISVVLMTELKEGEKAKKDDDKRIYCKLTGREALLNVLYQKDLDTTPCGMLFRKEIVLQNPFPVGRYHEDDYTMYKYFETAKSVALVKKTGYFYVQHASSIMHRKSIKILRDEIEASDNLEEYFEKKEKELYIAAKSKKFSNYCQILLNYSELVKEDQLCYEHICSYLKNNKKQILTDSRTRLKNKAAALILFLGVNTFLLLGRIAYR